MSYTLHHGDCLEILPTLPAQSVDAVICDPPYGTTACKWDSVIPFEPMWREIKRVLKPRGACVLFGSQPFTSALVMSNPAWFKYTWVWDKAQSGSFLSAKYQPLRTTEDVIVFSDGGTKYNPQMRKGKYRKRGGAKTNLETAGACNRGYVAWSDEYFPTNVLYFPNCANRATNEHPTQKPVALMEYLVRTYTDEGDTVLDFTMGSGTTGVACLNAGRAFIGIERDESYFRTAQRRLAEAADPLLRMREAS